MIKVIYLYRGFSPICEFLNRQINESGIKDKVKFESIILEYRPGFGEFYKISGWHTVIFEDQDGNILQRIDKPFSSEDLKIALEASEDQIRGDENK